MLIYINLSKARESGRFETYIYIKHLRKRKKSYHLVDFSTLSNNVERRKKNLTCVNKKKTTFKTDYVLFKVFLYMFRS